MRWPRRVEEGGQGGGENGSWPWPAFRWAMCGPSPANVRPTQAAHPLAPDALQARPWRGCGGREGSAHGTGERTPGSQGASGRGPLPGAGPARPSIPCCAPAHAPAPAPPPLHHHHHHHHRSARVLSTIVSQRAPHRSPSSLGPCASCASPEPSHQHWVLKATVGLAGRAAGPAWTRTACGACGPTWARKVWGMRPEPGS